MNRNIQPASLSAAIDEFAAHLRAKRRAKNTVDGYVYVLHKALKTWGDISTDAIEPIHIDRFFAAGDWADSTQNQYLASLRVFFKWLRNSRYTWPDHDPTVTWEVARVRSKDRLRLSPDEFYPLMDACSHPRDRAVVALALFTLLRGSEIATLKWADVDFGAGLLHAVHHKTKLEDAKPIGEELREELVAWQNWYRLDQGTIKPEWFLVPAKHLAAFRWLCPLPRVARFGGCGLRHHGGGQPSRAHRREGEPAVYRLEYRQGAAQRVDHWQAYVSVNPAG